MHRPFATWVLLSGCTLAPGTDFAVLHPSFEGRFAERADRDAGAGWQKLDTDYQARLDSAALVIEAIELQDLGEGAGRFDPARPPEGYSLCHNGHCHHESGRLVPYEEIAAEMAGGSGRRTVVSLPVGPVDLLAPERRALECEPQCGLPRAHLRRARAAVVRVRLEGRVRDGRAAPRLLGERSWRWVQAFETAPLRLDSAIDVPADRRHPPEVTLHLELELTARWLDGLDWAALSEDGGLIDFGASANGPARQKLEQNLLETTLGADVSRAN